MNKAVVIKDFISRKQILETGIERLRRLLEAEHALEASKQVQVPGTHVNSGVTRLIEAGADVPPTILQPYQEFAPGVKVGYEGQSGKVWAVADFRAGSAPELSGTEAAIGSKLTVHPVFSQAQCTRWMTLEVDLEDYKAADFGQLKISLLADFQFSDPGQNLHTNIVRMTLRESRADGAYNEADIGYFPVTTMPKLHSMLKKRSDLNALSLDGSAAPVLLVWLPIYGSYDFNVYGVSVEFE